jgi:hypothetical protein
MLRVVCDPRCCTHVERGVLKPGPMDRAVVMGVGSIGVLLEWEERGVRLIHGQ